MDISDLRISTERTTTSSPLHDAPSNSGSGRSSAATTTSRWDRSTGSPGRPTPGPRWRDSPATPTIRLGTPVTSPTFRYPGPLAITVAQVDQMSGGRIELGLGAGCHAQEHTAYGIPFPPLGERFDQLGEQLAIITGLWNTPGVETLSHDGQHFPVIDAPALPKPIRAGGPPIIVGGGGPTRTPALAARFAAEFNMPFAPIDRFDEQRGRVEAAWEAIDRDPAELLWSIALVACVGSDDAEVARRADAIGREPDELRENCVASTQDGAAATLRRWADDAGVDRIYLQVLDLSDLDHPDRIAAEVAPALA